MLRFEIEWDEELAYQDPTWGRLRVWLGDSLVWGTPERGDHWTWRDLLGYLADKWPWLITGEAPPEFVLSPEAFDTAYMLRKNAASPERQQELFELRECHDLSYGLPGVVFPPLRIFRKGSEMWVCSETEAHMLPHQKVVEFLEDLGDAIATRLADVDPELVEFWTTRQEDPEAEDV